MSIPGRASRALFASSVFPRQFNMPNGPLSSTNFGNTSVADFGGAYGIMPGTTVSHDGAVSFGNGGQIPNDYVNHQYLIRAECENSELNTDLFHVKDCDRGAGAYIWNYFPPSGWSPGDKLNTVSWGAMNHLMYTEPLREVIVGDGGYDSFERYFKFVGIQKGQPPGNSFPIGLCQVHHVAKRAMAKNVFCGLIRDWEGDYSPINLQKGDHLYSVLRHYEMDDVLLEEHPDFHPEDHHDAIDRGFGERSKDGKRRFQPNSVSLFSKAGKKKYCRMEPYACSDRRGVPTSLTSGRHSDGSPWVGKDYFLAVVVDTRGNTTEEMAETNAMRARRVIHPTKRNRDNIDAGYLLPEIEIFLKTF